MGISISNNMENGEVVLVEPEVISSLPINDEQEITKVDQNEITTNEIDNEFKSFDDINPLIKDFYVNEVSCFYDVILLIHNLNNLRDYQELKKKLHFFLDTYYYKSDDEYFYDYRDLFDYNLVNIMLLSNMYECEIIRPYLSDIREFASDLFDNSDTCDSSGCVDMLFYDDLKDEISIFAQKRLIDFVADHENNFDSLNESLEIAVRNYIMW